VISVKKIYILKMAKISKNFPISPFRKKALIEVLYYWLKSSKPITGI